MDTKLPMKHYSNKQKDKRGNKDWRKPWEGTRKSSNADRSCRCHGGCEWCKSNRTHSNNKVRGEADEQLKEYRNESTDTN